VALQGTLDTFALPDVLRLLAGTRKTGRLRVSGDRGNGSVWVDSGAVVASESSADTAASGPVDVLFELLRYHEGSFTFEAGQAAPSPSAPAEIEPLLFEAEHQLREWREIEAIVPSMDAWVTLAPALPRAEVVVDAARWRLIATVGSGAAVTEIADALGLAEIAACRTIKDLVEAGLAAVGEARFAELGRSAASPSQPPTPSPSQSPAPEPADLAGAATPAAAPAAEPVVVDEPSPLEIVVPGTRADRFAEFDHLNPISASEAAAGAVSALALDVADLEDEEVARQLATLSPKAAQAIAEAARAETEEERERALAAVTGDGEEPINRGLLLKFLSSVRS
jgi:hypothetical protein